MSSQAIPFRLAPLAASLLVSDVVSAAHVTSCQDDNTVGTLRYEVAHAAPGQTIDFVGLPLSCSTISLKTGNVANGPIVVNQASPGLTIQGPGANLLAIDGAYANRIITHNGTGPLTIDGLTLQNGRVDTSAIATPPKGGCIASYGSLYVFNSRVAQCGVKNSVAGNARGGGIYGHKVAVSHSTITGNYASSATSTSNSYTLGGGIYTPKGSSSLLLLIDCVVSNNMAEGSSKGKGIGGGAYCGNLDASYSWFNGNKVAGPYGSAGAGFMARDANTVTILGSTISANTRMPGDFAALDDTGGALFAFDASVVIVNSTISGNTSSQSVGGIVTIQSGVKFYNSTIAFNHGSWAGGAYLSQGTVEFESTIIANNTVSSTPSDLVNEAALPATITGSNNLVMSFNGSPSAFISSHADPLLRPLQINGGRTPTHMLSPGSPALGAGNNKWGGTTDQRGPLYPRATGPGNSVDIGAVQFDTIFADEYEGG